MAPGLSPSGHIESISNRKWRNCWACVHTGIAITERKIYDCDFITLLSWHFLLWLSLRPQPQDCGVFLNIAYWYLSKYLHFFRHQCIDKKEEINCASQYILKSMQDHPSFQRCLHLSCTISFFNRCMLQLHWRRLEIFAHLDTHPFWMMGTGWYVLIWWSSSTGIMLFVPCYVCLDILHLIYLSVFWIFRPLSDQCEEWQINIIWYACRIYLGGLSINLDFQFCTLMSLTKLVFVYSDLWEILNWSTGRSNYAFSSIFYPSRDVTKWVFDQTLWWRWMHHPYRWSFGLGGVPIF